jgi:hypothetical protein
VALLSKVNSVLIDADLLAHLEIVELERSLSLVPSNCLLLFRSQNRLPVFTESNEDFLALINTFRSNVSTRVTVICDSNIAAILHDAHHSDLCPLHAFSVALIPLAAGGLGVLRGEIGGNAEVLRLLSLVEDIFVDFESEDHQGHDD